MIKLVSLIIRASNIHLEKLEVALTKENVLFLVQLVHKLPKSLMICIRHHQKMHSVMKKLHKLFRL